MSTVITTSTHDRFLYIDGLRGLAAIMVVVGHLLAAAEGKSTGLLGPITAIGDYGRYGVQIFFVLSGFVIAHSVVGGIYTGSFLGRFAARRFVRLDLPYWSVIAVEIFLLWLSGKVMAQYMRELPSLDQILANAFYVQVFLGFDHILPIFWTLCYEVQFYIAFVGGMVLLSKVADRDTDSATFNRVGIAALAITFILSLSIYVGEMPNPHPALFVDRWFQFALGVTTYQCYRGRWPIQYIIIANSLCVIAAIAFGKDSYRIESLLITAGTSIAILASKNFATWRALLTGRAMQFLGSISYSLYLIHPAVGWRATVLARELLGSYYNTWTALLAFFIGVGASIIAAWMLLLFIERPAMRLSKGIRLPKRQLTKAKS
jgi:peptidoglycan/LPS O-acetylase OafA/YrhL